MKTAIGSDGEIAGVAGLRGTDSHRQAQTGTDSHIQAQTGTYRHRQAQIGTDGHR